MSLTAPTVTDPGPGGGRPKDDVPRLLHRAPSRPDRIFDGVLASSSVVVLLVLTGIVLFLLHGGWPAARKAGLGFFTDFTWAPDSGHFGMFPLLVGTVAIAVIGVAFAAPVSLATALMINEYAPRALKPILTTVIDLLATVPSIVYGFWGLEVISSAQSAPARWLAVHAGFIPIFRTPSPGEFVKSIFACGLICAVTIIPIIASISREVMAQTPRDVCEAALGLGGTRWGMVTNVIFPFSRNGILGSILLGLGRGLGETMIVVLVLSSRNILTSKLLGPSGLGSIPKQITTNFEASSAIYKSGLILLGLALFATTLAVNYLARLIVQRTTAEAV